MGPESGLSAAPESLTLSEQVAEQITERVTEQAGGGPDRVVHGRDRELRAIGAFVTGLDPTTLVVSGLSGSGKSVTVLAALHRLAVQVPVVRVVRSCSSRPYARGPAGRKRLDLSRWTAPAESGPGYEINAADLLDAAASGLGTVAPGPRVLFVDDMDVLSPGRASWLQHLGDLAYERDWRVVSAARHVPEGPLPDDVEVLHLGPLDQRSLRLVLDAELRMPLAADVAERLHWWSSGNPRIALELVDGLSPAQQRGSAHWSGPDTVGPVARRAYRMLLDGAEHDSGGDSLNRLALRYPLLELLCREQGSGADGPERSVFPAAATVAEVILDGLHLDHVSGMSAADRRPRAAARAVGVTLLSGTTWADDGARRWMPTGVSSEWTDHLWWRDVRAVDGASRAAGERTAAALTVLERTGRLTDPARLRADLEVIGSTSDLDWVGVCLQVRARLMLGDGSGARLILERQSSPAAAPRTVAELVAKDLAAARVAIFSGRALDAREHLAEAMGLRPSVADWLPVQGLLAVTTALLDGAGPTGAAPPRAAAWSHRALGEFAVDVGSAHLAVGQAERAVELLMIGLERCSWPYRGRAQSRADLVEAVVAAGHAPDGMPSSVLRLIEPPVAPEERVDADAAAAHARMCAMLVGRDALLGGIEDWLPDPPGTVSPWQRLRTLVAYGRHHLAHGDRAASELVLKEAQTLARLAGAPGWRVGVEGVSVGTGAVGRPAWERLGDNEREIVRLVLGGATNAQVAAAAYLSVRSVANRMRSIYTVLGIRDRRDLVEWAHSDPPGWLAGSA